MPPTRLYTPSDFRKIAEQLAEHDLRVTFHAPYKDLTPAFRDPMIREVIFCRIKQLTAFISIYRPMTVVCHTGYDFPRYAYEEKEWLENSKKEVA